MSDPTRPTEGLALSPRRTEAPHSAGDPANPKREVTAQTTNPANEGSAPTSAEERRARRPKMNAMGRRRFECDPIPGYRIHVFNEDRVREAMERGWELCAPGDVRLNQRGVGTSENLSGNTDLGACVSIVGNTQTQKRGVFMKIKEEWFWEDMEERSQANAFVMGSIFPGEPIDAMHPMLLDKRRYLKTSFGQQGGELGSFRPALLNRGRRVAQKPFVPHRPFQPDSNG